MSVWVLVMILLGGCGGITDGERTLGNITLLCRQARRYRKDHDRWPATITELQIRGGPVDGWGHGLVMSRDGDSLLIRSLGEDAVPSTDDMQVTIEPEDPNTGFCGTLCGLARSPPCPVP